MALSDLKRELRLTDEQLDATVEDSDLPELAGCFENTEDYVEKLGLTPGQQTDVMRIQGFMNSTEAGSEVLEEGKSLQSNLQRPSTDNTLPEERRCCCSCLQVSYQQR